MRFTNPKDIDVKSLSIHPEANMTPLMTEEQYNSLKNDIERNGQLVLESYYLALYIFYRRENLCKLDRMGIVWKMKVPSYMVLI